jgi:type VI secretion system protein ImpH
MEGAMRRTPDPLSFFRAIAEKPFAYDFYQTLRRIECLHPDKPRLGQGRRPADEAIRLGQLPNMDFAPAPLTAFRLPEDGRPGKLDVSFFGLLGPNGPLPLHLTEHARDRLYHAGDPTFVRFLDIFHHRFLLLFYRAWAQAQPTVALDRPQEDRFSVYVGSFEGMAGERMRQRDDIGDFAKLHFAGLLSRQVRNRDGLAALLSGYFRVPVSIDEFVGHWMRLRPEDRTRIGARDSGAQLAIGTVLGARVWDRQHKFRIRLGPLTLDQYETFLPGGKALGRLVAWVRQYLGLELEWDVRLVLKQEEVPKIRLGKYRRLGWTTWLGNRCARTDAADLTLDAERLLTGSAS